MISPQKTISQLRKTFESRHFTNSLWNVVDVAVYPIIILLTARMFMARLGPQQYGIWMAVNVLIAALSMVNIGFGDATLRFVARYRAENNAQGVRAVVQATLTTYLLLGGAVAVFGLLGGWLVGAMDWHHVFKIEDAYKDVGIAAFQIGSFTFGVRLVEQILLSALKGFERYDAASRLSIASKVLTLGLNVGMVWLGFPLIQVFVNNAVVTLLTVGVEFWWVRRMVPGLSLGVKRNDPYLREVTPFGFWTWLQSMMGVVIGQLDKIMVTTLAGVAVFGFYSYAGLIAERSLSLLAAGAGFVFPIVSQKSHRNEPLLKMFSKMQLVLVTVGLAASGFGLLLHEPIFHFLLKEKYAGVAPFLPPFFIYLGVVGATVVPYYFLVGSGLARWGTFMKGISLVTQVTFVPLAYHLFGPTGIPLGLSASVLVASFCHHLIMAKHVFDTPRLPFALGQTALPLAWAISLNLPGPYAIGAGLVVCAVLWKWLYFDKVAFVFR